MTSAGEAYAAFLESFDADTWERCLEQACRAAAALPAGDERAEAVARALCIAIYLTWLGQVSGDTQRQQRARDRYTELSDEVYRSSAGPDSAWRTCWGLLLASTDFREHAATMLTRDGRLPPEHALLLIHRFDVKALAALRDLVRESGRTPFPPLVYEHGAALVSVGEIREARALAESGDWGSPEPLLLDILGGTSERLGQWDEAYAAYRRSSWPIHRYRAAIVGAIAGHPKAADDLDLDEPMRQYLTGLDEDLDQAGVARCTAFLNACLWHPVDDWRVELELGKLCFRRRQYAEADRHLVRSARSAPRSARFVISRLRFLNLTWLTGDVVSLPLGMEPETLSAGQKALSEGEDEGEDYTPEIRIWMANQTNDLTLIPASIDDWHPFQRAEAYVAVSDPRRAVDCYLESLRLSYYHRTAQGLIRLLRGAGLEQAVSYLVELVYRESASDFRPLWETAQQLNEFRPVSGRADVRDGFDQWRGRFLDRLVELSRFDFMNSIRTFQVASEANQPDLAEEMLRNAARLAEGVSELLLVASLRRQLRQLRPTQSDQEGLWCLLRARGQARDRVERLQVAGELFRYGRGREAREILREERALQADTPLSHAEMTAVLRCGQWLSEEERARQAHRAATRLNQDARSGVLGPYPGVYATRLLTAVGLGDNQLGLLIRENLDRSVIADFPGRAWPGRTSSSDDWVNIQNRIDRAASGTDPSALTSLGDWLRGAWAGATFGFRVTVIAQLRAYVERFVDEARRAAPTLPEERTPIVKSVDGGAGVRTVELCDMWRMRLSESPGDAARGADQLREFFDSERALLEEWESDSRRARQPALGRVLGLCELIQEALASLIGPQERAQRHPVLRALFDRVELDLAALASEIAEQSLAASGELAEASPAADPWRAR